MLRKIDRDIIFSLSNSAPYGDAPVWQRYANCWRTTGDIRDTWGKHKPHRVLAGPLAGFQPSGPLGRFRHVGCGDGGLGPQIASHETTADEQYTHISLWSLLASPMLIGCDIAQMDDFTMSLLTNDEVNDVNQDPLGIQAYPSGRKTSK